MNAKTIATFCLILLLSSIGLTACGPTETPVPENNITITNITENNEVYGEIKQIKIFNQCSVNSPIRAEIQFNRSSGESKEKELVLSAGISGEAGVSVAAQVKVEASIQQHFATINTTEEGYREIITIEVPEHTQQEYILIWQEKRREGTIEYLENGEKKFANYSYRIGLEFASSHAKDISCLVTVTPSPTPIKPTSTPIPTGLNPSPTPTLLEKPITEGCIFSKTWQVDSTDADSLNNISVNPDGCYTLSSLGISAMNGGALRLYEGETKHDVVSGIYTPIKENSIIEFDVEVTYLYIVYPDKPAYISFAVAPANDPLTDKSAARFKLLVEENQKRPVIFFVMADADESVGSKVIGQHYEYGRRYKIRLEISGVAMSVYINNVKMDEDLDIPDGSKVFYIGYNLPIVAGVDLNVTNITIDGMPK